MLGDTPELRAEVERWVDLAGLKGDLLGKFETTPGNVMPGFTIPIFTTMLQYIPWWRLAEGLLFHGDRRRPLLFSALKLRGIHRLPPPARAAIRKSRRAMEAHLDHMEELLDDGRTWICGETFTLADVSWMAIFERLDEVDWTELFLGDGKRPRIEGYFKRLKARPSYESALGRRSDIHIRALQDLREAKRSSPELREILEAN